MPCPRRSIGLLVAAVMMCGGCNDLENNDVRGRGLDVASLPAAAQSGIYAAAARAGFDTSDPTLWLLVDPRYLPRETGLAARDRMAASVIADVRQSPVFRGTCEPPLNGKPGAPQCAAQRPGYVLRFSPVFRIGQDSTQVYVYVQQYDNPQSGHSEPRRYERAYQVVRQGGQWRAVREGNVSKEVRGESK